MKDEPAERHSNTNWRTSFAFLLCGAGTYLCGLLTESGRELFPSLWEIAMDPLEPLGIGESLAISAFLMMSLVTLVSPFVATWLTQNRLMRIFFRSLSVLSTTILGSCAIAWYAEADAVLFILVISSALTLTGLLWIKPVPPPEPTP